MLINLSIDEVELEEVQDFKYLLGTLDGCLDWNTYINQLSSKLALSLFDLKIIFDIKTGYFRVFES